MERSEPSLVPEWLRNTGGGTGAGSFCHNFASSQADGPVLALPKRNRSSKSIGNADADALHSSILDRSSSSNSRRSSSSNGLAKHDKSSFARSYSSFTRSQRDRDRETLTIADNWDYEYSDPMRNLIPGRIGDTLKRSQSMISRRHGEAPQERILTDTRNGSHNNHDNRNGTSSVVTSVTGVQKVSFERDFPLLGSDERPKTPDIIRVSSPGLSRGIQNLSIVNSPLVGAEGWTSALAEVPTAAGSNGIGSSPALEPPTAASASASGSHSTSAAGSTSSGLNMAEALVQAQARPHNAPQPSVQTHRDELAIAQSKKLIPMTPLLPKTLVSNPSDKLKPKTPVRSSEAAVAPKNGVQQLAPLQLGSHSARGSSIKLDGPKSPSSGRLLLLKPGRDNGVSPALKDGQSQTTNVNSRVSNGQSAGASSVISVPLKNINNLKLPSGERKGSAFGLISGPVVDKRSSTQSRNDFFKMMRKKTMNNTSGTANNEGAVSSDIVDNSDKELKEVLSVQVTPVETRSEVKCNGETCKVAESISESKEADGASIYPNEEEEAFLRSLGWEESAGDDEGLTEEEIKDFLEAVKKLTPTSKLYRNLQPKILSHCELGAASTEPSASASQTEA